MARNLKLFNHWIAEVRDIAISKKVQYEDEDNPATRTQVKCAFCEINMRVYFDEGMSPLAAFYEEASNWG